MKDEKKVGSKKSLKEKLTANVGSKRGREQLMGKKQGIELESEEESPAAKKRKASKSAPKAPAKSQPVKKDK